MRSFRPYRLSFIYAALAISPSSSAFPQGWGEQAPIQFKYSSQGVTNEIYRLQFGASVAASASSSSGGGGTGLGNAQSSSNLNNAVQINNSANYNVTISGTGNYLNFGDTINAQQSSTGTQQTSANSTLNQPASSKFLNK